MLDQNLLDNCINFLKGENMKFISSLLLATLASSVSLASTLECRVNYLEDRTANPVGVRLNLTRSTNAAGGDLFVVRQGEFRLQIQSYPNYPHLGVAVWRGTIPTFDTQAVTPSQVNNEMITNVRWDDNKQLGIYCYDTRWSQ